MPLDLSQLSQMQVALRTNLTQKSALLLRLLHLAHLLLKVVVGHIQVIKAAQSHIFHSSSPFRSIEIHTTIIVIIIIYISFEAVALTRVVLYDGTMGATYALYIAVVVN